MLSCGVLPTLRLHIIQTLPYLDSQLEHRAWQKTKHTNYSILKHRHTTTKQRECDRDLDRSRSDFDLCVVWYLPFYTFSFYQSLLSSFTVGFHLFSAWCVRGARAPHNSLVEAFVKAKTQFATNFHSRKLLFHIASLFHSNSYCNLCLAKLCSIVCWQIHGQSSAKRIAVWRKNEESLVANQKIIPVSRREIRPTFHFYCFLSSKVIVCERMTHTALLFTCIIHKAFGFFRRRRQF